MSGGANAMRRLVAAAGVMLATEACQCGFVPVQECAPGICPRDGGSGGGVAGGSGGGACSRLPGMVAWWDGDQLGALDAMDIAGTHHGSLIGVVTRDAGLVGAGFVFTGTGHIEVPDDPALAPQTAMTIEGWVRSDDPFRAYQRLAGKQTDGSNASTWILGVSQFGGVYFGLFNPSFQTYIDGVKPLQSSTWHHVAGTWDGSRLRAYLDGVPEPSSPSFSVAPNATSLPVRIGRGDLAVYAFVGMIDELTLYDRALSAGEVAAIASARPAGKCK